MSHLKSILIRLIFHYILRKSCVCARKLGVTLGNNCRILDDPGKIFGSEPWLVKVGNHCEFTNGVRIITHEGGLWVARYLCSELENSDIFRKVEIGNNVMIGNYSVIMPGVKIGNNVIIGAHSVVTRDIEDNGVYAGVPARKINDIDAFIEKSIQSTYRYETKHLSQDKKKKYLNNILF